MKITEQTLDNILTPEEKEFFISVMGLNKTLVVAEFILVCNQYGYTDYLKDVDLLTSQESSIPREQFGNSIYQVFNEHAKQVIVLLGLDVNPDSDFLERVSFLSAISKIELTEDPDGLMTIIHGDYDSSYELLDEILFAVNTDNSYYFEEVVGHVSEFFIHRLTKMIENKTLMMENEEVEEEQVDVDISIIRKFHKLYPESFGIKWIMEGKDPGLEFKDYLKVYYDIEENYSRSNKQVAIDLTSMFLISTGSSHKNLESEINVYVLRYYSESTGAYIKNFLHIKSLAPEILSEVQDETNQ